jgi:hypothetical protein
VGEGLRYTPVALECHVTFSYSLETDRIHSQMILNLFTSSQTLKRGLARDSCNEHKEKCVSKGQKIEWVQKVEKFFATPFLFCLLKTVVIYISIYI